MGPGGGAGAKEDTHGPCDAVKVADGLVSKIPWGLLESGSRQGGREVPFTSRWGQARPPCEGTPSVFLGWEDQGKPSDRRGEGGNGNYICCTAMHLAWLLGNSHMPHFIPSQPIYSFT